MKAIVLGATGAVGKDLIDVLMADSRFEQVDIFVRKAPTGVESPKIKAHVVDFNLPDTWKDEIQGDVVFSCMGTTLKAAGSQEKQYLVDYTYQYDFAKAAADNNVPAYVLVSAYMANAHSRWFYPRVKGELEEAVRQLPFQQAVIVRPPSLIRKNTTKTDERIAVAILKCFNAIGLLRKQRPMPTEVVARCMVQMALNNGQGILEPQAIWKAGADYRHM